jgi:excisionase family DNA binding protein
MMLDVKAAAALLGISIGMLYSLAAPNGPIPCQRIGRTVRFDPADIEAYKQSCRCMPAKAQHVGVARLTVPRLKVSDPESVESELLKYCRERGITPKLKNSAKG